MLRLRPLQRWLNSQRLSAMTQKHVLVAVTLACFHTLKHWSRKDHLLRGVPLGVLPVRREVVTTDASLQGWGAVWRHQNVRGLWHSTQQHINVLEMRAVWLALQQFQRQLKDKHVLIRTDNTTVVFYINHQGGTRSQSLLNLAQRLWKWADVHLLSLRARYLPGRYNQIADSLSRANPTPWDWQIHKEVIQAIWDTYGRAEMDLFADKQTTHCPMWFSDKDEPGALGQDALAHSWPKFHLYAFPPLPLLWMMLRRIQETMQPVLLVALILAKQAMVLSAAASTEGQTMPPANKTRFVISGERDVVASKAPHPEVLGVALRGNPIILECSQGVEHTLLNVRAPSTRRAYARKWKAFSQWREKKEIVPHDCTLRDLLDFLQSLLEHGLSCSTSKVYVAALSAYRGPVE